MSHHVETRSLTKCYGRVAALVDCNLEIPRGEICGLLGPNGAGKTTLLRLLLGFLRPSAGWCRIDGLDCYRRSVEVHARTAYLPGDVRLFRPMTGQEVLTFFSGLRREGYVRRAARLAERLELDLSRQVARMSTGMRQKLALACVLASDTPLVVLDEPTSNLDPTVRSDVLALVREAQAAGRTVLFSSHILDEVEKVSDRVVILRRGELVHVQTMSGLRRQHRIRAQLTGPLPPAPPHLAAELVIEARDGLVSIVTPGELSPLLGWLATLPLAEVQIEPVGLAAVYEQWHPAASAAENGA